MQNNKHIHGLQLPKERRGIEVRNEGNKESQIIQGWGPGVERPGFPSTLPHPTSGKLQHHGSPRSLPHNGEPSRPLEAR